MQKPEYHIFVCNSFRVNGDPKGICHRKEAGDLMQYVEGEVLDRGLDAMVSTTGCLKDCEKGPVMIIYPNGWWYGGVDEDKIDNILDALEDGEEYQDVG
jgi:(2Fe-2S) ferredoxin